MREAKIEERIKQGYGQGSGREYKPWLCVRDFPSLGRCHRIMGIKSGRIHHLFSDMEKNFFFLLEWEDDIIDIREQFPLFPVTQTEKIAMNLGVKHPQNIKEKTSFVMTTDFLFQTKVNDELIFKARCVKPAKYLENKRILEKLSIEKEYWMQRGIDWQIVTRDSYNVVKCKNIEFILSNYQYPQDCINYDNLMYDTINCLLNEIVSQDRALSHITGKLDLQFDFKCGTTMSLFLYLAAHKVIPVKLEKRFLLTRNVNDLVDTSLLQAKIERGGDPLERLG